MITLPQLKAARALLDWTQGQLAKAAGVHLNVVNNIERGTSSPRQQTADRLQKALEDNGIVFIGRSGVELKRDILAVTKFEGETFLAQLITDILASTPADGEVLSILSDMRNFDAHDPAANKRYYSEKTEKGFRERLITRAMPGFYPRHSEQYRVIDPALLGPADMVIYGEKTAFIVWSAQEIAIVKNADVAATSRRTFTQLWNMGAEPVRAVRAAED